MLGVFQVRECHLFSLCDICNLVCVVPIYWCVTIMILRTHTVKLYLWFIWFWHKYWWDTPLTPIRCGFKRQGQSWDDALIWRFLVCSVDLAPHYQLQPLLMHLFLVVLLEALGFMMTISSWKKEYRSRIRWVEIIHL